MAFQFKQFSIDDSDCAMKVGTDSVLLGSWASIENSQDILDIGTGCGLLSLMAAQRSNARITAIDIDEKACRQADSNFMNSQWSERLFCHHVGLQEFGKENKKFDYIFSNPPFFINSLKSPETGRNISRHTDTLPAEVLIKESAGMLTSSGKFSLVFPWQDMQKIIGFANNEGLYLSRYAGIIPRYGKEENRVLMEFSNHRVNEISSSTIYIRDENGNYTTDYITLTQPFYLYLK